MEQNFNYYRIKTEWLKERDDGNLQKEKTEELVYATSYTEAEKIAYALVEDQQRTKFSSDISIEIVKTKISELLYNDILEHDSALVGGLVCNYFSEGEDTGVGLYSVKTVTTTSDEKSGKEKRTTDTIFIPATSNSDAARRVTDYLGNTMSDFVIRDVKFDKAEAILWPTTVQEQKQNDMRQ